MKLLKNVLVSVLTGHAFGILFCLVGAYFALKMPDSDLSTAIFGVISCAVGTLVMGVAAKKQSGGSVLCALCSSALYCALSFGIGSLLFEKDAFGWMELLMLAESFAFPLLFCFTGVTFMSKRRQRRRISAKIYK